MPDNTPRAVHSNQDGPHLDLAKIVGRHLSSPFQRPASAHTVEAFQEAAAWVANRGCPVVLDSGCGTGESTLYLAQQYPHCSILGIDKSNIRLGKAHLRAQPENALFIRAELQDFWILVAEAGWDVVFHAIYYPNPWPKATHFMRRFHGHPVFPVLLKLAPQLELRTNWLIYAQEFAQAVELAGAKAQLSQLTPPDTSTAITAFERKYAGVGQSLWQVLSTL